ncbi:ADP-ribosylglycohydrolase family protein [Mucilaginibacter sp.]|uniref:ADP-ribosylglycohydrolase family protein n=1 Tax=Mucilaginibacter sp. TaxID=1882438 RepID=UPI00374DB034
MTNRNLHKDILLGIAIGDALGVPVEFKKRQTLLQNPVKGMLGYGTHNQPAGTFSDDSSLAFCLAEALLSEFNLQAIADNFVEWYTEGFWTAHGEVFDVGIATRQSISRLMRGTDPELAGGFEENDNGNGSLMRILPLLVYIQDKPVKERFEITKQVSSLTHGHIRSVIACFYYLEFARLLVEGKNKFEAYKELQISIINYLNFLSINSFEIELFDRLLQASIHEVPQNDIFSSGYVLHTLEAAIWCLLTTSSYEEATLKAANLGDDTDTTAAVTGGLAGLLYGFESIPPKWMAQLARRTDIEALAKRLAASQHCK